MKFVASTPVGSPAPPPAELPKPANPEPLHEPIDPEKGRVKAPEPGKSEHPSE
jgi:hypothetical protein